MTLQIEYIKINKLLPYINNPKLHTEHQVGLIASSIKEYGFINPIIIDKDNEIVAGHGRLLAAKKLNMDTVPVIRAEHLTPAQVKAYRIADNKLTELGEWDEDLLAVELQALEDVNFDIELTGFDEDELNEILDNFEVEQNLENVD